MNELIAQFDMRYPQGATIHADLNRPAEGRSVTALFGTSGCGKTTILRCLAGLLRPQQGTIRFGEEVWLDSRAGRYLTPQQRNVGFLFQEYALFPHMTVAGNIGYGLRNMARTERNKRIDEMIERFDLERLKDRYPHQVSGGQQQRIALARVLARRPRLLLLDEPLSALDATLRDQMRRQLRHQLAEFDIPTILVTHDRREVFALADHLVVVDNGKIFQSGPVSEVFDRPINERVARLVGVETIERGRVVERSAGKVVVEIGATRLTAFTEYPVPDDVWVCIRAEDVRLGAAGQFDRDGVTITGSSQGLQSATSTRSSPPATLSGDNRIAGLIRQVDIDGPLARIELDCGFPLIAWTPRGSLDHHHLEPSRKVSIHIAPESIRLIST